MKSTFFVATVLAFALSINQANAALPVPVPVPTPETQAIPLHAGEYLQLAGCYHNTNGNCPAPVTSNKVDWAIIDSYLDYIETDQRGTNLAAGYGSKALQYNDFVIIHGGTLANYPQEITAFGTAYPLYLPTTNSGSLLGQVNSPRLWAYAANVVQQELTNSYGYYNNLLARLDDMGLPSASGLVICNSNAGSGVNCTGSSIADGSYNPLAGPVLPAPVYWPPQWTAGMQGLVAAMPVPVVWNDNFTPATEKWYKNQKNWYMGQCEGCISHNGYAGNPGPYWAEPTWRAHLDAAWEAEENGQIASFFNAPIDSASDATYVYASMWLAARNSRGVAIQEGWGTALTPPPSALNLTSTMWYVPWGSYDGNAADFDAVGVGYPFGGTTTAAYGIGKYRYPTGVYGREWAHGTIDGVDYGPTAVVVNPQSTSEPWPSQYLSQGYSRTLSAPSFAGQAYQFGDNGGVANIPTVSVTPPPLTIPANSAVIAFR